LGRDTPNQMGSFTTRIGELERWRAGVVRYVGGVIEQAYS